MPAAYRFWFGDDRASYIGDRISTYVATLLITVPPTALTILMTDFLTGQQRNWRRRVITIVAWQAATFAVLACSYEFGLSSKLNRLDLTVFGPPNDLYGWRNLVLPRVLAWILCTTPPACVAMWFHETLARNRFLKW